MVTGGGIEQGETIAETAIREVKEEAGIDVVFVRELGVAESPTGHYVQVTPTERLPETWEHDGRAFRWLPVSADLELWGQRGDFVSALVRKRVVGYVTRGRELLVFDHKGRPEVPTQVPAGRVDAHEGLEEGLRREVEEETGLTEIEIVGILADGNEFERALRARRTRESRIPRRRRAWWPGLVGARSIRNRNGLRARLRLSLGASR